VPHATSAKSSNQAPLIDVNSPTPISSPQFAQPTQDPNSIPWNAGNHVTSHGDAFSGPVLDGESHGQDIMRTGEVSKPGTTVKEGGANMGPALAKTQS
jgi:hypothetical protein